MEKKKSSNDYCEGKQELHNNTNNQCWWKKENATRINQNWLILQAY